MADRFLALLECDFKSDNELDDWTIKEFFNSIFVKKKSCFFQCLEDHLFALAFGFDS